MIGDIEAVDAVEEHHATGSIFRKRPKRIYRSTTEFLSKRE
jgi:hypothetical protein